MRCSCSAKESPWTTDIAYRFTTRLIGRTFFFALPHVVFGRLSGSTGRASMYRTCVTPCSARYAAIFASSSLDIGSAMPQLCQTPRLAHKGLVGLHLRYDGFGPHSCPVCTGVHLRFVGARNGVHWGRKRSAECAVDGTLVDAEMYEVFTVERHGTP